MIILTEQVGLQNVYTPLPLGIHLVFSIFATIIFLVQFYRKNRLCYLLAALAIDATLVTHFAFENKIVIIVLEIIELLLVLGCITDILFTYINRKKKMREEKENESISERQQKEREKKEIMSDKDILDNAFDRELNDLDDGE